MDYDNKIFNRVDLENMYFMLQDLCKDEFEDYRWEKVNLDAEIDDADRKLLAQIYDRVDYLHTKSYNYKLKQELLEDIKLPAYKIAKAIRIYELIEKEKKNDNF